MIKTIWILSMKLLKNRIIILIVVASAFLLITVILSLKYSVENQNNSYNISTNTHAIIGIEKPNFINNI